MSPPADSPPVDPADPRTHLPALLARGEVVHWSGGPDPARGRPRLASRLGAALPAGLGVLALALAAALAVLRPAQDVTALAMALFGILFLAYGLARRALLVRAAARSRRRFLAVTDRRVIVLDGAASVAIAPHALRGVMALDAAPAVGDLHVFHRADALDTRAPDATLTFEDLPDASRAAAAIEALARRHGVDIADTDAT
ncbi:MAG: hypothetical protein M5U07_07410 [Xanthobacteraceae bacterium]|nr:hypothetical protein [Xanthobacteraceae bacterium]